ncbi:MAG: MmgE/PrpD family protein [Chloroflexota bacterium]
MTTTLTRTSLTPRVAAYATGLRHEAISPEVLDRSKQLFLDFLGVALGGVAFGHASAEFRAAVRSLMDGATGRCTVVGERDGYPAHFAALLNAAYAHSMDFDDTHRDAVTHPGTPLFAGLLAAGEPRGVSGRDFLTAAVVGYEINGQLGRAHAQRVHRRGFHPTATTGIFAVTAAAGRLMGLDQGVIEHALGLDLSFAAGTAQFSESGGSNKPVQVGMAAHNALYCLALAAAGVAGTGRPLEGTNGYFNAYAEPGSTVESIDLDPSQAGEVLTVAVKPYPACRYTHASIDGVSALVQREALTPDDILSIELALPPDGFNIVGSQPEAKRRPATIVDAQFSVYFAAAVAAAGPAYTWDSYRRLTDPTIEALMDKTTVRPGDLTGMATDVKITSRRGAWTMAVPFPKGEPEVPISWPEVEAKFRSLATGLIGAARADEVLAAVQRLETVGDIGEVTRLLRAE